MAGPFITTALRFPRGNGSTGIPQTWINDNAITFDALGFLLAVSYAEPGKEVDVGGERRHPLDPPVADLIAELVDAGYLDPAGDSRYELVHPDRLPPLPDVPPAR